MADDSLSDIEQWRPVPGYEGYYDVSSHGRVRRIRGNSGQQICRQLKLQPMPTGYLKVDLWRDNIGEPRTVHSLVVRAFLGEPPSPEHEVAHWDRDRTNCRLGNLRWATRAGNYDDSRRHGTNAKGERHGNSRLTADDVRAMRAMRKGGALIREIAVRFGVNRPHAGEIVRGKLWAHVGME